MTKTTSRRPRRRSTETWSASSTITYYDTNGAPTTNPTEVTKATIRWRYNSKQPRQTFHGQTAVSQVAAFQTLLTAAHANDWPADATGRPIPTHATQPEPVTQTPLLLPDPPAHIALPQAPPATVIVSVADLVQWRRTQLKTTKSLTTGKRREGATLDQYDSELNFIAATLTYPEGDQRLAHLVGHGIGAGDSLLVDENLGVNEFDLRRMMSVREHTNLGTRAKNERALKRWRQAREKEVAGAAKAGRPAQLLPTPDLETETTTARTVSSLFITARAMFTQAARHGMANRNIWTLNDDERPRTRKSMLTTDNIYDPAQVSDIVAQLSKHQRGKNTGDRYVGYVLTAAVLAPRPGAARALRVSKLHLDAPSPHVVWEVAVKDSTKRNSPTGESTHIGTLKHRDKSVKRTQLIPDLLIPILQYHIDHHVPEPTIDNPDPLVFTTHTGAMISNSNFRTDWWVPVIEATYSDPTEQRILRSLRKTGITDMLLGGVNLKHVADQVGSSQAVVENNYAAIQTHHALGGQEWPEWNLDAR